ncbi:MAG: radical SAM protein [Thermodesulfobacteriota bacterium]
MKLVLIQPPIQDFYQTRERLQPLGLAYLKGAVKKYLPGVEVVIKDFHQGRGKNKLPLPEELAYLEEYYPYPDQSPFSLFHPYYHFGASFEIVARETAAENPDLVGISALFSPYYREVLRCAEAIKSKTHCPMVLGGSHVSAVPEMMLAHEAVDWVIRGEGERPLVELIRALESGGDWKPVPGLGYKEEGRMVLNPIGESFPLNEIPLPDFSDLDQRAYRLGKRPLCFILFSRGCPHHCSFCSVHCTFPGYRRRPVNEVFKEIESRYQEGYRVFDFEDDNLTHDRQGFLELCRLLVQRFPPGEIELLAMNGISYHDLEGDLLSWMKKAGFSSLNLSLVTADPVIGRKNLRPRSLEKFRDIVNHAHRLGFKLVSYQILGLPGEPLSSMIHTLLLNTRLPVLLGASPFYLNPGSPLARTFPPPSPVDLIRSRLSAMAVETDHFSREDIYTLFIITRIINFFKGLSFPKNSTPLREAIEAAGNKGERSALGVEIFQRLLEEGRLYATTREGLKPLPRFKPVLFRDLWSKLDCIVTREGKTIEK